MYNTLNVMPDYYKAGIYIRLSEADEGKSYESESESVLNQRNILMNFIKEKGFIFAAVKTIESITEMWYNKISMYL